MIYKSALIAAAVLAFMAIVTGKTVRSHRMVTLNGLKYEVTRYSNDIVEVAREDGLRFDVEIKSGAVQLHAGTPAQLQDATTRLQANFLAELGGGIT